MLSNDVFGQCGNKKMKENEAQCVVILCKRYLMAEYNRKVTRKCVKSSLKGHFLLPNLYAKEKVIIIDK